MFTCHESSEDRLRVQVTFGPVDLLAVAELRVAAMGCAQGVATQTVTATDVQCKKASEPVSDDVKMVQSCDTPDTVTAPTALAMQLSVGGGSEAERVAAFVASETGIVNVDAEASVAWQHFYVVRGSLLRFLTNATGDDRKRRVEGV